VARILFSGRFASIPWKEPQARYSKNSSFHWHPQFDDYSTLARSVERFKFSAKMQFFGQNVQNVQKVQKSEIAPELNTVNRIALEWSKPRFEVLLEENGSIASERAKATPPLLAKSSMAPSR